MNIYAKSPQAKEAKILVENIQNYFVSALNTLAGKYGQSKMCEAVTWGRDEGRHGGGLRFEARDTTLFNRGSVNVSQVHYDDDETKKLASATAVSTIIHPQNPHAPSMHMHISWTQMRDGKGYWRIMADLNPSLLIESQEDKNRFESVLKKVSGTQYHEAKAQGDRYFYIPVLSRTRGVSHFYLENYTSGDFDADKAFAQKVGEAVVDCYCELVAHKLALYSSYTDEEKAEQLAYHTLYLFQVLTLDRGTTSGLLVHEQNDIGIMGSIPSHVDRALLATWMEKMPKPQDKLLRALLEALPDIVPTPVEEKTKKSLAEAVRQHYKKHPEALSMQASGNSVPPTVANHS